MATVSLPLPENHLGSSPWGDWAWRKGATSSDVVLHVPSLSDRWFHPIELYSYRHLAREAGDYAEADFMSHLINLCGLRKRAKLSKRGALKPWNKGA